jgi:N-acetylmuramoyl-L-alanine amidase
MFFSSRSRYQVLLLTLLAGYLLWGIPTALQAQRLFTVVIDAGHGGKDPGTVGNGGKEKDITLSVAKIVGRKIKANHPEVRVLYTRETDTFVGLQARADYANRHKASLMLSIHVNSAPTATVNGTETYVLGVSKFANNLSVAMRENKAMLLESDYKTTYRGFDPTSTESYIMFDLMQDAYITKSIDFANRLQRRYRTHGCYSRGVRQDILWVLSQSAMPSVLTEIGFLTNKQEANLMLSSAGQEKIADAISEAFTGYYMAFTGKSAKDTPKQADATEPADTTTTSPGGDEAGATTPSTPEPSAPEPKKGQGKTSKGDTKSDTKGSTDKDSKGDAKSDSKGTAGKEAKSQKAPKGITYRVQFLTSPKKLEPNHPDFRHLPSAVERMRAGNKYIYLLDHVSTREKAQEQLRQLPRIYRDAFIIRYRDGVRIRG